MRIAVWHNLPSGGGKRALYDQIRGLIGRGHTVEAWCPPTADREYLPLSDMVTEHVVPGTRPVRSVYSLSNVLRRRTHNLRNLDELDDYAHLAAEEINRGKFDLLFANTSLEIAISSIGRYTRIPKVLYLQEPSRWLYEAQPHLAWAALPASGKPWWSPGRLKDSLNDSVRTKGLRIQAREEWLSARAFDDVLVNSFFSRETMLHTYGVDAKVCYLGVDNSKFVNLHLPKENFVMGIGAIAPRKNVGLVIEALALIDAKRRPRLVWIGDVSHPKYLAELTDLACSNCVEFAPGVSITDGQLVDLLNRALMLVYTPRLEPFGYAPLEANACGLPVVAVAEGGVRETVVDGVNGLLVQHDPRNVAAAIEHLIENRDVAIQLGEEGERLVAEHWTVDAAVERLEQRLTEVLMRARTRD